MLRTDVSMFWAIWWNLVKTWIQNYELAPFVCVPLLFFMCSYGARSKNTTTMLGSCNCVFPCCMKSCAAAASLIPLVLTCGKWCVAARKHACCGAWSSGARYSWVWGVLGLHAAYCSKYWHVCYQIRGTSVNVEKRGNCQGVSVCCRKLEHDSAWPSLSTCMGGWKENAHLINCWPGFYCTCRNLSHVRKMLYECLLAWKFWSSTCVCTQSKLMSVHVLSILNHGTFPEEIRISSTTFLKVFFLLLVQFCCTLLQPRTQCFVAIFCSQLCSES